VQIVDTHVSGSLKIGDQAYDDSFVLRMKFIHNAMDHCIPGRGLCVDDLFRPGVDVQVKIGVNNTNFSIEQNSNAYPAFEAFRATDKQQRSPSSADDENEPLYSTQPLYGGNGAAIDMLAGDFTVQLTCGLQPAAVPLVNNCPNKAGTWTRRQWADVLIGTERGVIPFTPPSGAVTATGSIS
jgi:hypothetical protein